MQRTIGGLTDHIVNKEIHHWLALTATSLTPLSHTSGTQMQIGAHTQTHNNWAADNGAGADAQSQQARFGGWESCATLTAGEGFIRAVGAVSPSITVPVGGDAAAAGASELSLGACGGSYVEDVERHEISWRTCQCGILNMLMSGWDKHWFWFSFILFLITRPAENHRIPATFSTDFKQTEMLFVKLKNVIEHITSYILMHLFGFVCLKW